MVKAKVVDEESISIVLDNQQAALLKLVIGRFANGHSGPLHAIWDELDDIGIDNIPGVRLIAQSEPNLYLVVEEKVV